MTPDSTQSDVVRSSYNLGLPTGILSALRVLRPGLGQLFNSDGPLSLLNLSDSAKWFVLGAILEAGRRLFDWLYVRLRPRWASTMEFNEGNSQYDWIVHFLTQERLWKRSREFRVVPKSSKLRWGIDTTTGSQESQEPHAEYVPTFEQPQLFKWRGYVMEVQRENGERTYSLSHPDGQPNGTIRITMYTKNLSLMSQFVEDARLRYLESSKPNVIIHMVDAQSYGSEFIWNNVKSKAKRPLSSVILGEGVMTSLLDDVKEFIQSEEWYVAAGIPYRRGYLLYGPPGTGKSSTIYALAGELGLDIYAISLAASIVDDSFLQRAASSIPKGCIFLIEDVDCCFSRDDEDEGPIPMGPMGPIGMSMRSHGSGRPKSAVSMSALLNVIDGVGSEAGRLFFATTNYVDHLDSAFLRPGRIDKKVEYYLATKAQAASLFKRFFPNYTLSKPDEKGSSINDLSELFAEGIPKHEFSTAELQGYLLLYKREPRSAAENVKGWVEQERISRQEREERLEEARKKKLKAAMDMQAQMQASQNAFNQDKSTASASASPAPVSLVPLKEATPNPEGKTDGAGATDSTKPVVEEKSNGHETPTIA
ncbi:hypothetical protein HGRIS_008599 [Hohenbuehelia grisea]|uniref:Mitochondrial chaperone BCS1 n=1 Tax=Hohenbuehelia grisea TaxID=104357 RepID=A0ABR3J8E3_9AGAR